MYITLYNWRIKISHKCHTFIRHVKIYVLSAIYANLVNLIHASKQSARKQTHRKFAAVTRGACCKLKQIFPVIKFYFEVTIFYIFNQNIWFNDQNIQRKEFG